MGVLHPPPPPPPPPLTSLATSFGFYPSPNPHRLPLNLLPPLPHRPAALFIPNLTNPPRYLNYTSDFNPFGLIPVARDPLNPRSAQRCQDEAGTNSFFSGNEMMSKRSFVSSLSHDKNFSSFLTRRTIKLALLPWSRDHLHSTKSFIQSEIYLSIYLSKHGNLQVSQV